MAFKSLQERFDEKYCPEPNTGCWLWTASVQSSGYGAFDNSVEKNAHRLSYRLHIGPIPDGLFVCHHCDVRCCVNPDHLFVGTHQDNVDDMQQKGRGSKPPLHRGEYQHASKLTSVQAREIKSKYTGKYGECTALGREYGVDRTTISKIVNGTNWKHEGKA